MPSTATIEQEASKRSIQIMERALCLSVRITQLGKSRKVSPQQFEVHADKAYVNASKRLLVCKEFDAISSLVSEIRAFVDSRSLPCPVLRSGVYLIPMASVREVDARMNGYLVILNQLVEALVRAYPAQIEVDRERLQDLFDLADYPTPQKVTESFKLEWQFFSFGVDPRLPEDIRQAEEAKMAANVQDTTAEITRMMRTGLRDLAAKMAEKLSEERDGGKPGIFRDSLVTNMLEFLGTFDARNIVEDEELAGLVDKARSILAGVDADVLRKNQAERSRVAAAIGAVATDLDGMIEPDPERVIRFED